MKNNAFQHTWLNIDHEGKQAKLRRLDREIARNEVKKTNMENELLFLYSQRQELLGDLNR